MTPARPIGTFSDHKVLLTPAGAWGVGDSPPRLSGLGYLLAYHPPAGSLQEALSAHSPGILRRHNEGTVGRGADKTEVRALGGRGRCCNYTPELTLISAPEGREKVRNSALECISPGGLPPWKRSMAAGRSRGQEDGPRLSLLLPSNPAGAPLTPPPHFGSESTSSLRDTVLGGSLPRPRRGWSWMGWGRALTELGPVQGIWEQAFLGSPSSSLKP